MALWGSQVRILSAPPSESKRPLFLTRQRAFCVLVHASKRAARFRHFPENDPIPRSRNRNESLFRNVIGRDRVRIPSLRFGQWPAPC